MVFPLLFALILALAACGGDDALSDEEYFQKMDEIDKDLDAQFDEVFSGEDATAGDVRDGFWRRSIPHARNTATLSPPATLRTSTTSSSSPSTSSALRSTPQRSTSTPQQTNSRLSSRRTQYRQLTNV